MATTPGLISQWVIVGLTVLPMAVGWALLTWIAGGVPTGRFLIAGWIGSGAALAAGLVLWQRRERQRRAWESQLRDLADSDQELDVVALVSRFRAESSQASAEINALSNDLHRLTESLAAELEGRDADDWPEAGPTAVLSRSIRELVRDQSQDAKIAAELLSLWIQQLESARLGLADVQSAFNGFRADVQEALSAEPPSVQKLIQAGRDLRAAADTIVPTAKAERRVLGTRGGSKREPADSWLALLSPVFHALNEVEAWDSQANDNGRRLREAADEVTKKSTSYGSILESLETDARRLRRRLGRAEAKELTEDDFVT